MRRYQPLLFQPVPSRLRFPLAALMEEVRAAHFVELVDEVEVRFERWGALAFVVRDFMGPRRHIVCFHPVLNHPDTPPEVVRFICKHELTHIVRPPRMIRRDYEHHPPEFWEYEAQIGPERHAAWHWLHKNLVRGDRTKPSGYRLKRAWRTMMAEARTPYTPHLPLEPERFERICPGGEAQLRLPPVWVARPLP